MRRTAERVETVQQLGLRSRYQDQGWGQLEIGLARLEVQQAVAHLHGWFRSPGWEHIATYHRTDSQSPSSTDLAFVFEPHGRSRFQRHIQHLYPFGGVNDLKALVEFPQDEVRGGGSGWWNEITNRETLMVRRGSMHPNKLGVILGGDSIPLRNDLIENIDPKKAEQLKSMVNPHTVCWVDFAPLSMVRIERNWYLSDLSRTNRQVGLEHPLLVAFEAHLANVRPMLKKEIKHPTRPGQYHNATGLLREVLARYEAFPDLITEPLSSLVR